MEKISLPQNLNVNIDNVVNALLGLIEVMHANGLDSESKKILSENGIKYDIAEE